MPDPREHCCPPWMERASPCLCLGTDPMGMPVLMAGLTVAGGINPVAMAVPGVLCSEVSPQGLDAQSHWTN